MVKAEKKGMVALSRLKSGIGFISLDFVQKL